MFATISYRQYILIISMLTMAFHGFGQHFLRYESEVGLSHTYDPTAHIGGGAVIIDVNNDGFMDVYLPGGRGPEKLYLNNNGETFTDISASSGLTMLNNFYTVGGVAGDFNGDGYEDLFITTWQFVETGGGPNFNAVNQLLYNNGDNTFSSVGGMAEILDPAFSASATLLDVNLDGRLDIYVVDYVEQTSLTYDENTGQVNGFAHQCFENKLYINNLGLYFENEAELYQVNDSGCGLAAAATNYNRDGYTDLMVVNDFGQWISPNKLYAGNAEGFEDVSETTASDIGIYAMGVAVGDYDEDGDLDYYFTNIGRNVLLAQQSEGAWLDLTTEAGVEDEFHDELFAAGWSTFFFDYDNDSYLDLYVSNGRIPSAPFIANSATVPNRLFRNNQDGTFTDWSTELNLLDTAMGRGAVFFDFNNDGKLDILQVNIFEASDPDSGGTVLYVNNTDHDHHFVMFDLKSITSAPHGIGARVELHAAGRTLIREVDAGSGFASHNDKRIHFGLGEIALIDSVEVFWPGYVFPQTIYNPEVDLIHEIVQEEVVTALDETSIEPLIAAVFPNPVRESLSVIISRKSHLEISLLDQWGRVLKRDRFSVEGTTAIQLDDWISPLAAGIYTLTVWNGERAETKRFAVVK